MSITSQSHFPEGSEGAMKLLNCCSKVLLPGVYLVLHIVSSVFPALFQETALGQLFVIKPSLQKTRWETRWAFGHPQIQIQFWPQHRCRCFQSIRTVHREVIGDQHPNKKNIWRYPWMDSDISQVIWSCWTEKKKNERCSKHDILVGGWALPLWKIYVFVSWDDEIPNINEKNIHVPKHQPVWLVHLAFNIWLRYG